MACPGLGRSEAGNSNDGGEAMTSALIRLAALVIGALMVLAIFQGNALAVCTAWAGFGLLSFLRS